MLTVSNPPGFLHHLTLADVTRFRDAEWETRERAYHDTAVDDLNALVRKYNGLAPYAVRRPYYMLSAELDKAYRDSGEDILQGIAERAKGGSFVPRGDDVGQSGDRASPGSFASSEPLRFRELIREWWSSLRTRS